jgi:hypothetical protein
VFVKNKNINTIGGIFQGRQTTLFALVVLRDTPKCFTFLETLLTGE